MPAAALYARRRYPSALLSDCSSIVMFAQDEQPAAVGPRRRCRATAWGRRSRSPAPAGRPSADIASSCRRRSASSRTRGRCRRTASRAAIRSSPRPTARRRADASVGNVAADLLPRLPEVRRLVDERIAIVHRGGRSTHDVARCRDRNATARSCRIAPHTAAGPLMFFVTFVHSAAAVARVPDLAVVGAGPDQRSR